MSWAIKHLWFVLALGITAALTLLSYFLSYSQTHISYIWEIDSALSVTTIVAPVLAGLAAVRSWVQQSRAEIVSSFPARGQFLAYVADPIAMSGGAIFGLALASAVVTAISLAHGNAFAWLALAPLPVAIAHIIAMIFLGAGLGYIFPYLLTGPLVVIALYVATAFDVGGLSVAGDYAGASVEWLGQMQYSTRALLFLLVSFLAFIIGGLAVLTANAYKNMTLSAIGIVLFVMAFSSLSLQRDIPLWESRPFVSCANVGHSDISICVPTEQKHTLVHITRKLEIPVNRLVELDPSVRGTKVTIPGSVGFGDILTPSSLDVATAVNFLWEFSCVSKMSDQVRDQIPAETRFKMTDAREEVARWLLGESDIVRARKAYMLMTSACDG
ncbi:hypothetical protein ACFPGO_05395 [Arcanobacterium canis]|uniref:Uncharacterized protein n=1 Tax=Arcanobacterium canis TaxID=999183 RepID=A0ABY8FZ38_9ACTO|nr:hypothetical protein [Arcanobacterium canis]WFM83782.1 hypothetical protein P7079_02035 [Arcanobacterium canis]